MQGAAAREVCALARCGPFVALCGSVGRPRGVVAVEPMAGCVRGLGCPDA